MIQKFIAFVVSLIGVASALSYEYVDFRPEISTEMSTVLLNIPNPDNPDEDECPCDKKTGIITHGDGHRSKCPCLDGECGCVRKGDEDVQQSVPQSKGCDESCSCASRNQLQIPTPSSVAIDAAILEEQESPATIPIPLMITEEQVIEDSVQSDNIITVQECVDGSCTTTTYSGSTYSSGPTYRKGPLGIFWWRVRR